MISNEDAKTPARFYASFVKLNREFDSLKHTHEKKLKEFSDKIDQLTASVSSLTVSIEKIQQILDKQKRPLPVMEKQKSQPNILPIEKYSNGRLKKVMNR